MIKRKLRMRKDEYFAGRFCNTKEVMELLRDRFSVTTEWEVFVKAHESFGLDMQDSRVKWLVEKTFQDCCNGASLPQLVLAAFFEVKYQHLLCATTAK